MALLLLFLIFFRFFFFVDRALEQSDADARKEMVGNVVLTGGGSLFDGMPERITSELTSSLPSAFKVSGYKIHGSGRSRSSSSSRRMDS